VVEVLDLSSSQCLDTGGGETRRTSSLYKPVPLIPNDSLLEQVKQGNLRATGLASPGSPGTRLLKQMWKLEGGQAHDVIHQRGSCMARTKHSEINSDDWSDSSVETFIY